MSKPKRDNFIAKQFRPETWRTLAERYESMAPTYTTGRTLAERSTERAARALACYVLHWRCTYMAGASERGDADRVVASPGMATMVNFAELVIGERLEELAARYEGSQPVAHGISAAGRVEALLADALGPRANDMSPAKWDALIAALIAAAKEA